jgi:hypothetical protein
VIYGQSKSINIFNFNYRYTYIEKKIPIEAKPVEVKNYKKLDQRTKKYLKLKSLEP